MTVTSPPPTPKSCPPNWPSPGAAAPLGDEFTRVWVLLVPQVVHPIDVAIVEALLWLEQPLSAAQLTEIFDSEAFSLSLVSRRVRKLAACGVLELVETRVIRGCTAQRLYFFPATG